MSADEVCRICLGVDSRMLPLVPLQDVYEKVTNQCLYAENRPLMACYLCIADLRRCYRFIKKSGRSEAAMETLLRAHIDITPKSVAVVDRVGLHLSHPLAVTPVKHEGFESDYLVVVKSEPLAEEELNLKDEGDPLTEDMAVSEAEDNSEDDDIPLGSIQQEKNQGQPGSSQAAMEGDPPPLPLEVNIKVEGNDSDDVPEKHPEKHKEYDTRTSYGLLKVRPVKGYECTICQRRFDQYTVLKNHLRTHTGEKPFACKLCDSKFSQYSSLTRHTRSHTGQRPYLCNICKRAFNQSCELKKHIRTHTGEKPYTCEICKKSFSLNKHLKSHIKVHTGEKPYECDICHVKFKEVSHMRRHKATHSAEKPFECNACGSRFKRRCNLVTHLMIHSGTKNFECKICHAKFSRPTHLKGHMQIHERDKAEKIDKISVSVKVEKLD